MSRLPEWATRDVREIVAGALALFIIVTIAFAPFAYGDRTLMSSAAEAPSLYNTGAQANNNVHILTYKQLDPGAAAWQTEPELFLEHQLVAVEHVAPLWNPYVAYGQPLAADMLSQPFFPLTWTVIAHPTVRAYNWFIILRIYIAALFAFLYLRMFVGFSAALAGAVGFSFTGYFLLFYNIAHISVECLIPAVLWAIERVARRPGAPTAVALAAVLAVVIFGGMPESAILAIAFGYVYFVVRVVATPSSRVQWRTQLVTIVAASLLGAGFSACLSMPFLEFLPLSVNQHAGSAVKAVIGLGYDGYSFPTIAPYLAPLLYGPPLANIFSGFSGWTSVRGWFGIAQTYFALVAIITSLRALRPFRAEAFSPVLFFALTATVMLLKRFGSPVVNWIGALPGLNLVIFPKYGEPITAFCLASMAAVGIHLIAERRVRASTAWFAAVVPLALLTAIVNVEQEAFSAITKYRGFFFYALGLALVVLVVCAAIAWLSTTRLGTERGRVFARAMFGVVLIETFACYFIPMWYVENEAAPISRSAIAGAPYVSFLQSRTAVDHARFYGQDYVLYPEWASAFQISDVRDLNALYDVRYLAFVRAFLGGGPSSELVDRFTGVRSLTFTHPLEERFLQVSSAAYVGMQKPIGDERSLLGRALVEDERPQTPLLHVGSYSIAGVRRSAVFMHAPQMEYPVRTIIPARARTLRYSIGFDPGVWSDPKTICGDGVTFVIDARDTKGRIVHLARRYIDPKHNGNERRWNDFSVPIGPLAGKNAELLFSTLAGPSGMTCADWALWSNVTFDVQTPTARLPFSEVYKSADVVIYHYERSLPRLAIYTGTVGERSDAEALARLTSSAFDPARSAVITLDSSLANETTSALKTPHAVSAGNITTYTSQYVAGNVDAESKSLVVLNDTNYPGWFASIDGNPAPILTANYMFRGVVVPAGHHVVEFRYRPQSFQIGLAISGMSVVIAAVWLALAARRRRQHSDGAKGSE